MLGNVSNYLELLLKIYLAILSWSEYESTTCVNFTEHTLRMEPYSAHMHRANLVNIN
jgi:hypothetical protein